MHDQLLEGIELIAAGDEGFDEARRASNLAVDQRPAYVALPRSAEEVAAVLGFARANGLRVAPQGTGHGAGPLGSLDDVILLRTERLDGVEVDADSMTARVGAGVKWAEVVARSAPHGLMPLCGSSGQVGVVGYTLGGGIGWLVRRYGAASESLLAADVVTPDGRIVHVDHDSAPDLHWSLRGGGGAGACVVTAIEILLYPVSFVYGGMLAFPLERAVEVLTAWLRWADEVPETVTSVGRLLNVPPLPDIPEPVRGRSLVAVQAAMLEDDATGARLLEPLRALGPELDTFAVMPAGALLHLHMDPEEPVPAVGDGTLLGDVTPETIEAVVGVAGAGTESPLVSFEFRHLGGRLREERSASALHAPFATYGVGIAMTPELGAACRARLDRIGDALAPWTAGRGYRNFAERATPAEALHDTATLERLRRLRAEVDPEGLLVANHPVA